MLGIKFGILSSIVFLSTVSIYSYASFDSKNLFLFDGSSTIKPLLSDLLGDGLNIQSSGTNSGLKKLLDKKIDFALSSQDQYPDLPKDELKNKNIISLPLAKDAIFIVYKPPVGCSKEIVINQEVSKTLFSMFFNRKYDTSIENNYIKLTGSNENDPLCNAPVVSFARSGGHKKSGTAFSFLYSNPWITQHETNNEDWVKKLKNNEKGNDFGSEYLEYTPENNKVAYRKFQLYQKKDIAKMIYLSGSFVFLNKSEIEKQGYKIALTKENQKLDKDNWFNTYKWIRNLNLLYLDNKLNAEKKKIIKDLINKNESLKKFEVHPIKYAVSNCDAPNEAKCCARSSEHTININLWSTNGCI